MITTTSGLVLLATALTLLVASFAYTLYKTNGLRNYPDRTWRLLYMVLITCAISYDLTIGLLNRNGYEVVHPWCCLAVVPLFGAVATRLLGFTQPAQGEDENVAM